MLFKETAGIVNGVNIALAMLVHELSAKGLISKENLAAEMERAVQQATERAVQKAGGNTRAAKSRVDLVMLRNLARLLRAPAPQASLDGGRASDQDGLGGDLIPGGDPHG